MQQNLRINSLTPSFILQNRTQASLFPLSLDDSIDPENEVRIIDLFVDSLKLADYRFRVVFLKNYL
jgi:hypothetical protein